MKKPSHECAVHKARPASTSAKTLLSRRSSKTSSPSFAEAISLPPLHGRQQSRLPFCARKARLQLLSCWTVGGGAARTGGRDRRHTSWEFYRLKPSLRVLNSAYHCMIRFRAPILSPSTVAARAQQPSTPRAYNGHMKRSVKDDGARAKRSRMKEIEKPMSTARALHFACCRTIQRQRCYQPIYLFRPLVE